MSDIEETPPYTRNPLSKFCDRAEDYVKYRPSYPAAAIDIRSLKGIGTKDTGQATHAVSCRRRDRPES